jgi:hypothetical protein
VDAVIAMGLFVLFVVGMVVFWQGFQVGEPPDGDQAMGGFFGRAARSGYSNSTETRRPDVQRHRGRNMLIGAGLMALTVLLGIAWTASI